MTTAGTTGPLSGLKVIELAGAGPAPFGAMLLGDMGADVLRIDRLEAADLGFDFPPAYDIRNRNKRSLALNLKDKAALEVLRALIAKADILIEGFRPGVAERLGIGPEDCWKVNPRLAYGRATGWGQSGPMAQAVGHDINYIAMTGALSLIGSADGPPVPPLNLLGDYAGGGAYLAFGLVCAVLEARNSGRGQVVDAAMVDGVTSLMSVFHAFQQMSLLEPRREANLLDGGAPFYRCYETRDGKYLAVGAIEARFWAQMLAVLGLDPATLPNRDDRAQWPVLRQILADAFRIRSCDDWMAAFSGVDACVSPVLTLAEVANAPHNRERDLLVTVDGVMQPTPAPRLSRTPGSIARGAPAPGAHTAEVLREWAIDRTVVEAAEASGGISARG